MARKGGWRRTGSKGRFRYLDARGRQIEDEDKLARIESIVIPPAWRDVWISPNAAGEAAGDRRRQRRPAAVPLPPGVPGAAGAGEVRQARPVRRQASGSSSRDGRAHDARSLRARARLRGRGAADQPGVVPRRHRPLCQELAHVRSHDADEASRLRARQPDLLSLSREAQAAGADDARRRRARLGAQGPARAAGRGAALPLRARRRDVHAHGSGAQRVHPGVHGRGIHARKTSAPGVAR